MRRSTMLVCALAAALVCAQRTQAAIILFDINLDGLQETPPVATPGSGVGTLTLDDSDNSYSITGTFQDLIGTTNNAHIHGPAAPGVAAGVVVGLTFDFGVTSGNYSGAGTFTAGQVTNLMAELFYVNIHSTFRPGGEIRGQILLSQVPEPGSLALLACGGVALVAVGWRRVRRRA
ncbi:MAG: CHRD domain-containing protein [Pirellulales bacterium]